MTQHTHFHRLGGDGFDLGSPLLNRSALADGMANSHGVSHGGARHVYKVAGYIENPQLRHYWAFFRRMGLARKIVEAPVYSSWRKEPDIYDDEDEKGESEWSKDVDDLLEDLRARHYFKRADTLAGIGRFGVLVIGFDDVDEESGLEHEVESSALSDGADAIKWLNPYAEDRVGVAEWNDDPTSEHYQMPETYEVEVDADRGKLVKFHRSRVIHVAEGVLDNETYGRPRLEPVLNDLMDVLKTTAGGAEAQWRNADQRLIMNVDPSQNRQASTQDRADLREQGIEFTHRKSPMLRTVGVDAEMTGGEDVDNSAVFETSLDSIASTPGVPPKRILKGSERGELASTQDRNTWLSHVATRQETFCEPAIVRAFIDRMVEFGILDAPKEDTYHVEWGDLFELSEQEKAQVMLDLSKALKNLAPGGEVTRLATIPEMRSSILRWGEEVGSEADLEEEEATPDDPEETDPIDEDDEEVSDQFDILSQSASEAVATDGGEDQ